VDSEFITASGMNLYLLYKQAYLNETIDLSVSDGRSMLNTSFSVIVKEKNSPPILNFPPLHIKENEELKLEVDEYIIDKETPLSELVIKIESEIFGRVGLTEEQQLILTYDEGTLEDYLKITVIDDIYTVYQTVRITVIPTNDAPILFEPKAKKIAGVEPELYNFTVWYTDEELSNEGAPEPVVELILGSDRYSMIMLIQLYSQPVKRLYGITLAVTPETYNYHYQCDDGSGAPNSENSTAVATLEVPKSPGAVDGDNETEQKDIEITSDNIRFLFWLIVIFCTVILLIIVNVLMFYTRIKERKVGRKGLEPDFSDTGAKVNKLAAQPVKQLSKPDEISRNEVKTEPTAVPQSAKSAEASPENAGEVVKEPEPLEEKKEVHKLSEVQKENQGAA
jgi:hypothetical protein